MFIEEYLEALRRERFNPFAIAWYLRRIVGRARDHMVANPGAVRSIWSVALGFFTAAFLAAATMALAYDRALAYQFFLHTALWILLSFGLVTLYVGSLRDRDGYPLSAINLPIALSLLRVTLVPGITLFLLDRHFALALVGFVTAALTDVADGWIARRWNQVTRLGTVLDPIVDVVFNLAMLAGLTFAGLLDGWVLALALVRYGILLVGGAYLYLFVGPVRIQPTLFGRLTGVLMSALIGFLVLLHVRSTPLSAALIPLTRIALGALLGSTVGHVLALGWYNLKIMTGHAQQRGRVVGDVRWGAR